jgi:hypothetical protein
MLIAIVIAIPLVVFPWFVGMVELAGRAYDARLQRGRDRLRRNRNAAVIRWLP